MVESYVATVARLEEILAQLVPSLGPLAGEPVPLTGGITNHNFRVSMGGTDYVVRVHGRDTDLLGIDRQAERLAGEAAAEIGIAPALVAAFDDCLVTRFVDSDAVGPAEAAEHLQQIASALLSFHRSSAVLPSRFWVPDLLEQYAALVRARHVKLPREYGHATAVAAEIAAAVPLRRSCPCHNDLLAGNIIRARGGELLIVDWEYAGMGHPCFDLGNLSVNNDFSDADDERLLYAYYGEPPSDARRAELALMRILSDAREAAWGVVQAEVSELEFDFDRYARTHFERLRAATQQPQLGEWLAAAGATAQRASSAEEPGGPAA